MRLPRPSPRKWAALVFAKLPRPSLATWAGIGFVGIAGLAVLVWWLTDALDDWAPNAAVEALSIAATIVIVERIIRHEARERLRPRIDTAMSGVRGEFRNFVHDLTWDYAATHLHTFRPFPPDALDFLDHWLAEKDAQDACPVPLWDTALEDVPLVLHEGSELGNALRAYRELDREVMEPELVSAIDDYLYRGVQYARLCIESASPAKRV